MNSPARELVLKRAVPRTEIGLPAGSFRAVAARNPARREVFRLLGIYLPEREARELLKQVHDYKWIQAEKLGYDVWHQAHQKSAFSTAARYWAHRYLDAFLSACNNRGPVAA